MRSLQSNVDSAQLSLVISSRGGNSSSLQSLIPKERPLLLNRNSFGASVDTPGRE